MIRAADNGKIDYVRTLCEDGASIDIQDNVCDIMIETYDNYNYILLHKLINNIIIHNTVS